MNTSRAKPRTAQKEASSPSTENKFCHVCNVEFSRRLVFIQHLAGKHVLPYTKRQLGDTASYFCHLCQKVFPHYTQYMAHVMCHAQAIEKKMQDMTSADFLCTPGRSRRIANQRGVPGKNAKKRGRMSPKGEMNTRARGRPKKHLKEKSSLKPELKPSPLKDRRSSGRAAQKQALSKIYISSLGIPNMVEGVRENKKRKLVNADVKDTSESKRSKQSSHKQMELSSKEATENSTGEDEVDEGRSDSSWEPDCTTKEDAEHMDRAKPEQPNMSMAMQEVAECKASIDPSVEQTSTVAQQDTRISVPFFSAASSTDKAITSPPLASPNAPTPTPTPATSKKPSFLDSFMNFISNRTLETPMFINRSRRRFTSSGSREKEVQQTLAEMRRKSYESQQPLVHPQQPQPVTQSLTAKQPQQAESAAIQLSVQFTTQPPSHLLPKIPSPRAAGSRSPRNTNPGNAATRKDGDLRGVYYYGQYMEQLTRRCSVDLGARVKDAEVFNSTEFLFQNSSTDKVFKQEQNSAVTEQTQQCTVSLVADSESKAASDGLPGEDGDSTGGIVLKMTSTEEGGVDAVEIQVDRDVSFVLPSDEDISQLGLSPDRVQCISSAALVCDISEEKAEGNDPAVELCVEGTLSVLPIEEISDIVPEQSGDEGACFEKTPEAETFQSVAGSHFLVSVTTDVAASAEHGMVQDVGGGQVCLADGQIECSEGEQISASTDPVSQIKVFVEKNESALHIDSNGETASVGESTNNTIVNRGEQESPRVNSSEATQGGVTLESEESVAVESSSESKENIVHQPCALLKETYKESSTTSTEMPEKHYMSDKKDPACIQQNSQSVDLEIHENMQISQTEPLDISSVVCSLETSEQVIPNILGFELSFKSMEQRPDVLPQPEISSQDSAEVYQVPKIFVTGTGVSPSPYKISESGVAHLSSTATGVAHNAEADDASKDEVVEMRSDHTADIPRKAREVEREQFAELAAQALDIAKDTFTATSSLMLDKLENNSLVPVSLEQTVDKESSVGTSEIRTSLPGEETGQVTCDDSDQAVGEAAPDNGLHIEMCLQHVESSVTGSQSPETEECQNDATLGSIDQSGADEELCSPTSSPAVTACFGVTTPDSDPFNPLVHAGNNTRACMHKRVKPYHHSVDDVIATADILSENTFQAEQTVKLVGDQQSVRSSECEQEITVENEKYVTQIQTKDDVTLALVDSEAETLRNTAALVSGHLTEHADAKESKADDSSVWEDEVDAEKIKQTVGDAVEHCVDNIHKDHQLQENETQGQVEGEVLHEKVNKEQDAITTEGNQNHLAVDFQKRSYGEGSTAVVSSAGISSLAKRDRSMECIMDFLQRTAFPMCESQESQKMARASSLVEDKTDRSTEGDAMLVLVNEDVSVGETVLEDNNIEDCMETGEDVVRIVDLPEDTFFPASADVSIEPQTGIAPEQASVQPETEATPAHVYIQSETQVTLKPLSVEHMKEDISADISFNPKTVIPEDVFVQRGMEIQSEEDTAEELACAEHKPECDKISSALEEEPAPSEYHSEAERHSDDEDDTPAFELDSEEVVLEGEAQDCLAQPVLAEHQGSQTTVSCTFSNSNADTNDIEDHIQTSTQPEGNVCLTEKGNFNPLAHAGSGTINGTGTCMRKRVKMEDVALDNRSVIDNERLSTIAIVSLDVYEGTSLAEQALQGTESVALELNELSKEQGVEKCSLAKPAEDSDETDPEALPELCIVTEPAPQKTASTTTEETNKEIAHQVEKMKVIPVPSGSSVQETVVSAVCDKIQVQIVNLTKRAHKPQGPGAAKTYVVSVDVKDQNVVQKAEEEDSAVVSPVRKPMQGVKSLRNIIKPKPFVWELEGVEDPSLQARNERTRRAFKEQAKVAPFTWDMEENVKNLASGQSKDGMDSSPKSKTDAAKIIQKTVERQSSELSQVETSSRVTMEKAENLAAKGSSRLITRSGKARMQDLPAPEVGNNLVKVLGITPAAHILTQTAGMIAPSTPRSHRRRTASVSPDRLLGISPLSDISDEVMLLSPSDTKHESPDKDPLKKYIDLKCSVSTKVTELCETPSELPTARVVQNKTETRQEALASKPNTRLSRCSPRKRKSATQEEADASSGADKSDVSTPVKPKITQAESQDRILSTRSGSSKILTRNSSKDKPDNMETENGTYTSSTSRRAKLRESGNNGSQDDSKSADKTSIAAVSGKSKVQANESREDQREPQDPIQTQDQISHTFGKLVHESKEMFVELKHASRPSDTKADIKGGLLRTGSRESTDIEVSGRVGRSYRIRDSSLSTDVENTARALQSKESTPDVESPRCVKSLRTTESSADTDSQSSSKSNVSTLPCRRDSASEVSFVGSAKLSRSRNTTPRRVSSLKLESSPSAQKSPRSQQCAASLELQRTVTMRRNKDNQNTNRPGSAKMALTTGSSPSAKHQTRSQILRKKVLSSPAADGSPKPSADCKASKAAVKPDSREEPEKESCNDSGSGDAKSPGSSGPGAARPRRSSIVRSRNGARSLAPLKKNHNPISAISKRDKLDNMTSVSAKRERVDTSPFNSKKEKLDTDLPPPSSYRQDKPKETDQQILPQPEVRSRRPSGKDADQQQQLPQQTDVRSRKPPSSVKVSHLSSPQQGVPRRSLPKSEGPAMVRRRQGSSPLVTNLLRKKPRLHTIQPPQLEVIRVDPVMSKNSDQHRRTRSHDPSLSPRTVHTRMSAEEYEATKPSSQKSAPAKPASDQKWLIDRQIANVARRGMSKQHFPFAFSRARSRKN